MRVCVGGGRRGPREERRQERRVFGLLVAKIVVLTGCCFMCVCVVSECSVSVLCYGNGG